MTDDDDHALTPMSLIEEFYFTARTYNVLRKDYPSVKTVWQLAELTAGELLRTPNFGRKCLIEVEQALASCGLRLAHEKEVVHYCGRPEPWYEFSL